MDGIRRTRSAIGVGAAAMVMGLLVSCGGDGGSGPNGGDANFTAKIDGSDFTASAATTAAQISGAGNFAIVGASGTSTGTSITLVLYNIGAPGTYPLGVSGTARGGLGTVGSSSSSLSTPASRYRRQRHDHSGLDDADRGDVQLRGRGITRDADRHGRRVRSPGHRKRIHHRARLRRQPGGRHHQRHAVERRGCRHGCRAVVRDAGGRLQQPHLPDEPDHLGVDRHRHLHPQHRRQPADDGAGRPTDHSRCGAGAAR